MPAPFEISAYRPPSANAASRPLEVTHELAQPQSGNVIELEQKHSDYGRILEAICPQGQDSHSLRQEAINRGAPYLIDGNPAFVTQAVAAATDYASYLRSYHVGIRSGQGYELYQSDKARAIAADLEIMRAQNTQMSNQEASLERHKKERVVDDEIDKFSIAKDVNRLDADLALSEVRKIDDHLAEVLVDVFGDDQMRKTPFGEVVYQWQAA
jgi:hypothetical protein